MPPRRPLIGGPYDGGGGSPTRDAWAFIGPDGRAFRRPGPFRALYLNCGESWQFAGHDARVCTCGAAIRTRHECPLCGAT